MRSLRTVLLGIGAAVILFPTAGWAQEVSGQSTGPAPVGGNEVSTAFGFPWDQLPHQIVERRYRVEVLSFKARDETGFDWASSDEVMVEVCGGTGCTTSDEIGDMDSGDTHDFLAARSCVFGVVPGEVMLGRSSFCDIEGLGRPAPVNFRVEMWEKDPVGFDFGFCAVVSGSSHHWPSWCTDDGLGDDFIGWAQVEFPIEETEAALPEVGGQFLKTVVLSPCKPGMICGGWDLADYSLTYRVVRVPDGRGFPKLELAEAMRRIGSRSELETVIAALRTLRTPEPRRPGRVETGLMSIQPPARDRATGPDGAPR